VREIKTSETIRLKLSPHLPRKTTTMDTGLRAVENAPAFLRAAIYAFTAQRFGRWALAGVLLVLYAGLNGLWI
jgi:hypothetical protein